MSDGGNMDYVAVAHSNPLIVEGERGAQLPSVLTHQVLLGGGDRGEGILEDEEIEGSGSSSDDVIEEDLIEANNTKAVCARGGVHFDRSDDEEVLARLVGQKVERKKGAELRPRRPWNRKPPCLEGRTLTTRTLRLVSKPKQR
ncbi:hypothetical protein PIB30_009221 [Stylosanthes scabra]|uniref:Uncharacterized protein n=1 Tax=Stylosanthes scabra TaxID=79078 RepID=A0ABU6Q534_9FABA|nr:hypothetical protein [Stylosanthes scabra]